MDQAIIKAEAREKTGKGSARATRRAGRIPAVVYSHFEDPVAIALDPKELRKAVTASERGFNTVLSIEIGNSASKTALLKDWQVDPINRKLLHADFIEIRMDERLPASVPVKLVGRPTGVVEGGILNQIRRELTVRCLPGNIPVEIEIDVSHLHVNEALHVSDVPAPEGVEIPYNNDFTIAVVTPPEAEEVEVAPEEEALAAAEAAAPGAPPAPSEASPPEEGEPSSE